MVVAAVGADRMHQNRKAVVAPAAACPPFVDFVPSFHPFAAVAYWVEAHLADTPQRTGDVAVASHPSAAGAASDQMPQNFESVGVAVADPFEVVVHQAPVQEGVVVAAAAAAFDRTPQSRGVVGAVVAEAAALLPFVDQAPRQGAVVVDDTVAAFDQRLQSLAADEEAAAASCWVDHQSD